jgi:hypothetical protein
VKTAARPLIEFHHPMTFRGRGVAAPFTTPLLVGTRVRQARPGDIELVVSSPSGGRGIYILNWPGVRALCNPTVHDTVLFRRCSQLPAITPALIRDTALEVALAGHAGPEAAAAAETAMTRDRARAMLANVLVVTGLLEQVDPDGRKIPPAAQWTEDLDWHARAVLHRIAPSCGRPPAQLAEGLMAIGAMFAPVGVASDDREARIPRLLIRLEETLADLSCWLDADPANDVGGLGMAITAAMRRACDSGAVVLASTRSVLADRLALLKRWMANAGDIRASVMRCDWLLDGWERVSLLWLSASSEPLRRAALLEMAPLVPVLPREVVEWTDTPIPPESMNQACRVTSKQDAWRTGGSAFALIERNEKLLAMRT